jgi:integrase
MQTAIATAMLTGLRQAEQFGLKVSDLVETPEGLLLSVHGTKTKNAERVAPVPKLLESRLRKLAEGKSPDSYLFAADDPVEHKSRGANEGRRFIRLMRDLEGLSDRHNRDWHSLRRTYSLLLETGGVEASAVSRLMGHSSELSLGQGYAARKLSPKATAMLKYLREQQDSALAKLPEDVKAALEGSTD